MGARYWIKSDELEPDVLILDLRMPNLDGQRTLCKCRAAPADQACLGRFDLRDNQPDMIRRREDRFDVPDLHRRRASQRLSVNRIGF